MVREPADRRHKYRRSSSGYAASFPQGGQPITALGQVIQRAEHQQRVCTLVSLFNLARVPEGRRGQRTLRLRVRGRLRLLHMTRHRIDEVHFVS